MLLIHASIQNYCSWGTPRPLQLENNGAPVLAYLDSMDAERGCEMI